MSKNLRVEIDIAAPPEKVWSVLSDVRRMPEFSPQVRHTLLVGKRMINVNRDGTWMWWPTSATITRSEPDRALSFRMDQNHSVWSFELAPTPAGARLTQTRDVSEGVPGYLRRCLNLMFRSEDNFEDILTAGMSQTLDRIKAACER